jgi:hypothetical protein
VNEAGVRILERYGKNVGSLFPLEYPGGGPPYLAGRTIRQQGCELCQPHRDRFCETLVGAAGFVGSLAQAVCMYTAVYAIREDAHYYLTHERSMGTCDDSYVASVKTLRQFQHPLLPGYSLRRREEFLASSAVNST